MPETSKTRWVVDLLIGVFEIAILLITATTTAVAIPPASAPAAEYDHVVNLYSWVVMATMMTALLCYLVRRRWIAVFVQMLLVAAGAASVIALHSTRVAGGLTGY
jgi:glucan phosphoethanolaminetransferase (alkaline phosphatase superfamily)